VRKSDRSLAKELGVGHEAVGNARKRYGSDNDDIVAAAVLAKQKIQGRNADTAERLANSAKKSFMRKVRRIDKSNASSIRDVLQDCKERYVKNEEIIQRLQWEVDQQDAYTIDNGNGSMSTIPALNAVERFIKLNISLRNQIIAIEQTLEISEADEEDPFN